MYIDKKCMQDFGGETSYNKTKDQEQNGSLNIIKGNMYTYSIFTVLCFWEKQLTWGQY